MSRKEIIDHVRVSCEGLQEHESEDAKQIDVAKWQNCKDYYQIQMHT